jgi:nucleotide-binding universal stress UspA family protein
MKDKFVTLAIHTIEQALHLQNKLEKEGIPSFIKKIRSFSTGVRVRVKEVDLQRAIHLVEQMKYSSKERTYSNKPFILVPMDFSEYAIHAGKLAFYLANNLNASIIFIHTETHVSTASFPVLLSSSEQKERIVTSKIKEREEAIIDLKSRFNDLINNNIIPNVDFSFELKTGIPEEEILAFSIQHTPLLVVMGTRSKDKKDQELIGSVTAEVIERSKVPVFVVPHHTTLQSIKEIKHIGYATNFDRKELVAFEKMMYFVQQLQFKVSFIHVVEKEEATLNENKMEELHAYFASAYPQLQIQFATVTSEKTLVKELDSYMNEQQIDILAIRNHKRGMLMRLFAPSAARKLVYQAKHPLIVFY